MTFRQIEFGSEAFRQECELRHRVLRVPLGLNLYDEDLSRENTQMHFGLFVEGTLVACAIAVALSSTEAKIRQMAVSRERQGQGYGRKMLETLERELAGRGFNTFSLHARVVVTAFYEKLGFKRIGSEFTEVGIPHVKMERRLIASNVSTSGIGAAHAVERATQDNK